MPTAYQHCTLIDGKTEQGEKLRSYLPCGHRYPDLPLSIREEAILQSSSKLKWSLMLDPAFVRNNLEIVAAKLRTRGAEASAPLDRFAAVDQQRRNSITELEMLNADRNRCSAEIQALRRAGSDSTALTEQVRFLKSRIETLQAEADSFNDELQRLLQNLPNLPAPSVPVGQSEHENVLVSSWGEKPTFTFTPKPHWEIGEALGILDFNRAAKISGSRFSIHFAQGARLERALAAFMLDLHTKHHGYTEVLPPTLVNSRSLFATGQLPKFTDDLFHCDDKGPYIPTEPADSDHWLIPTAEVPVTNIFRDETLEVADLPISFCAFTSCFRSEAGSYGKDVRGLIRQHQFQKVELVKLCTPQDSESAHEKLTRDAEIVLEMLGLPYRRMLLCTGDMGFASAKTYDIEVWLPGQGLYREISSCSNFESFQSRRANIRYRSPAMRRPDFVHTLNGSGLAVGRTYVALLENYQQADGTVRIPDALIPYMDGIAYIGTQKGPWMKRSGKERS